MYETMAVWEADPTLAAQSELRADFANVWQTADKIVYSRTLQFFAVGLIVAFVWGTRMRAVGPDAEDMAEDPVLHVGVAGASSGEVRTHTGAGGGIMPARANPTSEAARAWMLGHDDWRSALLTTVDAVDEHGVAWSSLWCSDDHVRFVGTREVRLGDDLVDATDEVSVSGLARGPPRRIGISLTSDGEAPPRIRPTPDSTIPNDCPPGVVETFAPLRF